MSPPIPIEKVVVITGASDGIGAELARQLAARGASVVLAARREQRLREVAAQCGPGALAVVTDVTQRADIERLLAAAIGHLGRVDVWVNNAGRGISKKVAEITDADFDEMMLVNAKSVLYGMQAVLPHFQARGSGHIINVSSMLGRVPFATIRSAYCASKHAMNALTACLRMDLRESHPGIHVSTVSPPVVATDFGLNALGGGHDSRQLPGAQPVSEVAAVIVELIERPQADVYTRPGARDMVVRYFAAEDMAEAEGGFAGMRPPATTRS